MTRAELVDLTIARMPHLSVTQVENAVKSVFEMMGDTLQKGGRIEIRNFGIFSLNYHSPHTSRNPRTGETIMTKGRHHVHFKPGKEMKDRVNGDPLEKSE